MRQRRSQWGSRELRLVVSAAAQTTVITDRLDPTKVNLSTFSLGPITFGNEILTPSAGASSYKSIVDLRPANDLLVEVNTGRRIHGDVERRRWIIASINPAAGHHRLGIGSVRQHRRRPDWLDGQHRWSDLHPRDWSVPRNLVFDLNPIWNTRLLVVVIATLPSQLRGKWADASFKRPNPSSTSPFTPFEMRPTPADASSRAFARPLFPVSHEHTTCLRGVIDLARR